MSSVPDEPRVHAFTVRVAEPLYTALRMYAFYNDTSMNDVIVRSVRDFLASSANQDVEAMVERAREKFRKTIEGLDNDEDP